MAALILLSCALPAAAPAPPAGEGPVLPRPLAKLVLAEDSDEITPVLLDHARHAAEASCAQCHHEGSETPGKLPGRCRSCHPLHAEEGKPPDL
ncbi:MAG: cytochrome c family protein [Planctomycetes bacterium]|jgi:hypothetical protein|nr:cytochrome c family protein [Planctomycetota bacterium]